MAELDPSAASRLIGEHLVCLPIESLPLAQCAGAVLRENVYAERDQPPFDRVGCDGVALASSAVASGRRRFRIQAVQAAGHPPLALSSAENCIEIIAGAVLPQGCDCVVPAAQIDIDAGSVSLQPATRALPWSNVHRRASDQRQGALLLTTGTVLHAPEIAVAASAGMSRLRVSGQPSIIVISMGSELVEPGDPIAPHQIRRSNAYAVAAALREHGFPRVAEDHLDDADPVLRERLSRYLRTHEVLVFSGGISAGKSDRVLQTLAALGVQCILHGVAQQPGGSIWFGTTHEGRAVFALPGDTVSTLVCLSRYVLPALFAAMGVRTVSSERIALAAALEWTSALTGFVPVKVTHDDWGRPWATPQPTRSPGDFTALALSDGFVELPPGPATLPKGFLTRLYRW